MTIAAVRCHPVNGELHTPFVTALRRTSVIESLLVEVLDADGCHGFGEAPQVWAVTGDSLAGSRACVEGPLTQVLVGADVDDLNLILRRVGDAVVGNLSAKAAVDMALHDLVARRRGISLPLLLGGMTHRVPTDVTVAAGELAQLTDAAQARVAEGFGVLKLKVGTSGLDDINRVIAVRQAVGPQPRIRLDANQGWSPREAVAVVSALEDAGTDIELVEQPVRGRDVAGLAWVTDRVHTPVMADESVFGLHDLLSVVERRAADLVNIKLAKCGGLAPARTLLDLARAHEMGAIVGSMMETHVGVGAAASLVAAVGTVLTSDLDAAWWAASAPVAGGLHYEGATVVLPEAPGLGLELHQ